MSDRHTHRAKTNSRGPVSLTRRRFLSRACDVTGGICATSSPLLPDRTQAAPNTAAPNTNTASFRDRAPFQIMALKDYPVPSSLQSLRVQDAKDLPLSGSYGQPHIMNRLLIEFAYDRVLLYEGHATPPWSPPDLDKLQARIYGRAAPRISGPDFNGVLFINGEGSHWNRVHGKGDNCWAAVDRPDEADRAVPLCISWVAALRQACPKALMAWYAKPAGAEFNRSFDFLQQIARHQTPLLETLDILSPSLYMWAKAYPDGFDRAVARFRDKLAWIRYTYPHKLLCPTVWEEFKYGNSSHRRSTGQYCPAQSGRFRYFATVATYNGKTGEATCAQPSFSRVQWESMLDMIVDVGCDGLFYWAKTDSWGKYFTDANEPGIRGLLELAERLDGAIPQGSHSATFYMDRGPFTR
jgi:hypothetical protein